MKIQFLGAAREVTGSKHLLTTNNGKQILLDCGVFQGKGIETEEMNRKLGFDPQKIDHIILTHAHIDHSGLIPYIYKLGFRGSIICTNATRDLCSIMLADAGQIHEHDTHTFNKKRHFKGLEPIEPIYSKADAQEAVKLIIGVPFDRKFHINENIKVKFTHTGHMLGSGVANIEITENDIIKRIAYTGDIGRSKNHIIKSPEAFPQAHVVITESTYGDRLHIDHGQAEEELLSIVNETCVIKKGKLIIPSFAVGRTQEIVFALNKFHNQGRLPKVDVYVDSPLAVNTTAIFRMHPECFNPETLAILEKDPDPFGFDNLFFIQQKEDSKKLNSVNKPCIIISSSGMMEAGRVKHHLANNISDPKNTVLAVGYCAPSTLGAKILRGDKQVSIHGNLYNVNADIRRIDAYSGHADYNEMIQFLNCQDKNLLQQLILVHGEYNTQLKYKEHLEDAGFKSIKIPVLGEAIEL